MGPTWGSPGSCRPQVGLKLAPWTLLSGDMNSHWQKYLNTSVVEISQVSIKLMSEEIPLIWISKFWVNASYDELILYLEW